MGTDSNTRSDSALQAHEDVWLRDLDGTGSMHVCAEGDLGAVLYRPAAAKPSPVAWMYERGGPFPARYIHDTRHPAYLDDKRGGGWTETPLFRHVDGSLMSERAA